MPGLLESDALSTVFRGLKRTVRQDPSLQRVALPDMLPLTKAFNLAITGDDEDEQLLDVCSELVRHDIEPAVVIRLTTVLAEIFADAAKSDDDKVISKSLLATLGHVCGTMTATMVSDMAERARRDTLTGLENRTAWEQDTAKVSAGMMWSVAMIDLDGLKVVNDERGHDAGDTYLKGFASELARGMPRGAVPYRLAGDEYVVRLVGGSEEQLRSALEALAAQGGVAPFSFGIAEAPREAKNAAQLLEIADGRMYEMKRERKQGRG